MPRSTRVLAFDPGFERLGVAVVEKEGGKERLLYSDCVRTSASLAFPARLGKLGAEVKKLLARWEPDAVALEDLYFAKNEKTALKVAEVRGALTYLAAAHDIPVFQYSPAAVKAAVTGWGRGDKRSVTAMIPKLVALPPKKRLDDELDAIAVALTHLATARPEAEGR